MILEIGKTSGNNRKRENAFSLLEIIIALAIISVLVTIFAVKFSEADDGESLRKPSSELRKMAKRANRLAAAYRDEYRITFYKDAFFLSRAPLVDRREGKNASIKRFLISQQEPVVQLQIRRLGSPKWLTPNGTEWVFQPAGLCEPIEVRFSQNNDFVEFRFNPMTAEVDQERFLFE